MVRVPGWTESAPSLHRDCAPCDSRHAEAAAVAIRSYANRHATENLLGTTGTAWNGIGATGRMCGGLTVGAS
jgi:hypothetical protein